MDIVTSMWFRRGQQSQLQGNTFHWLQNFNLFILNVLYNKRLLKIISFLSFLKTTISALRLKTCVVVGDLRNTLTDTVNTEIQNNFYSHKILSWVGIETTASTQCNAARYLSHYARIVNDIFRIIYIRIILNQINAFCKQSECTSKFPTTWGLFQHL